jgi:hypothetical protein
MRIKEVLKIREIAGEKIVILEKGRQVEFTRVMVLNKTSEWLWNQLFGKEFEVEQVAGLLQSKYSVDKSVALSDSLKWIETLKQNDIIEAG